MGLPLDDEGNLIAFCFSTESPRGSHNVDSLALHSILRLMSKLVSFISKAHLPSADHMPTPPAPSNDVKRLAWERLNQDFDAWSALLPPSYTADVVTQINTVTHATSYASEIFATEQWFANDACAVGHMYYHTAKIILLTRKPILSDEETTTDWLLVYRSMHRQMAGHAREIISVALGSANDAVRMHMLQPLYVAGRCLSREGDQGALVKLLKDLENDLGIATSYRVTALYEEWGTCSLHSASGLDAELSDLSSNET